MTNYRHILKQCRNGEHSAQTEFYPVNSKTLLSIDNTFGNVTITEWDRNEIHVKAEIKGHGTSQNIADQIADRISLEWNATGGNVSLKTNYNNSGLKRCNNCGHSVHYYIDAPAGIAMNLKNRHGDVKTGNVARDFTAFIEFGSLTVGNLSGTSNMINTRHGNVTAGHVTRDLTAYIEYGNLTVGNLSWTNNKINIRHGSLKAENINTLELSQEYGMSTITNARQLKQRSRHSNFDYGTVETLDMSSEYGDFNISNLGSLYGESSRHTTFKIGRVKKRFDISSLEYGGVTIDDLDSGFESVSLKGRHFNTRIGVDAASSFRVDFVNNRGQLKINEFKFSDFEMEDPDKFVQSVKGRTGSNPNPKGIIKIYSEYGNMELRKK